MDRRAPARQRLGNRMSEEFNQASLSERNPERERGELLVLTCGHVTVASRRLGSESVRHSEPSCSLFQFSCPSSSSQYDLLDYAVVYCRAGARRSIDFPGLSPGISFFYFLSEGSKGKALEG